MIGTFNAYCIESKQLPSGPPLIITMLTTPVIETHLSAFHEVIAECTDLKSRVETERVAVSAISAAIVNASGTLARRGYITQQKVEGLILSIEENALDLKAALDEVDASIRTAIGPVEKFAAVTERLRTAQRGASRVHFTAASDQSELSVRERLRARACALGPTLPTHRAEQSRLVSVGRNPPATRQHRRPVAPLPQQSLRPDART